MSEINIVFTQLNNEERKELSSALRLVAIAYYDAPHKIHTHAGICFNTMEIAKLRGSYYKIASLMKELGFTEEYFEGSEPTDTKDDFVAWEKRAMMCLFLSEYLYSTLEAELSEGNAVQGSPTKSIVQKAKDKVNEITENLRVYFKARGGLMSKLDKR
jgi:hypothetical protein